MSAGIFDRAALNRMYRYCYSLTNDKDAAYDLLQDGLERYLQARPQPAREPAAYLRRIIRNRFVDGLRNRGARLLDDAVDTDPDCVAIGFSSLESVVIAQQDLERIWDRLDAFDRELLHLWALEGYTAKEVAAQLELPLGTVLARIHRLRQRLIRQRADDADAAEAAGR